MEEDCSERTCRVSYCQRLDCGVCFTHMRFSRRQIAGDHCAVSKLADGRIKVTVVDIQIMGDLAFCAENVPKVMGLSMNEILLRGCTLKNSKTVWGLVIYTGPETRIQQNAAAPPRKLGQPLQRFRPNCFLSCNGNTSHPGHWQGQTIGHALVGLASGCSRVIGM